MIVSVIIINSAMFLSSTFDIVIYLLIISSNEKSRTSIYSSL